MQGGAILVVDDDPLVLAFVRRALLRDGYDVFTASNAEEALEVFSASPAPLDLILSDVKMPGLSGVQLAVRIREISPSTPTLLMSGFTDELAPGMAFLAKPFGAKDLLSKIRQVLQKATGKRVRKADASS